MEKSASDDVFSPRDYDLAEVGFGILLALYSELTPATLKIIKEVANGQYEEEIKTAIAYEWTYLAPGKSETDAVHDRYLHYRQYCQDFIYDYYHGYR